MIWTRIRINWKTFTTHLGWCYIDLLLFYMNFDFPYWLGSEFFSRFCEKVLGAKNGDYHSKGHEKLWGMGLDRKPQSLYLTSEIDFLINSVFCGLKVSDWSEKNFNSFIGFRMKFYRCLQIVWNHNSRDYSAHAKTKILKKTP